MNNPESTDDTKTVKCSSPGNPVAGSVYRSHICQDGTEVRAGSGGLLCEACGTRTKPSQELVALHELSDNLQLEFASDETALEELRDLLETLERKDQCDDLSSSESTEIWRECDAAFKRSAGKNEHLLLEVIDFLDLLDCRALSCGGHETLDGLRKFGCDRYAWPPLLWVSAAYEMKHGAGTPQLGRGPKR